MTDSPKKTDNASQTALPNTGKHHLITYVLTLLIIAGLLFVGFHLLHNHKAITALQEKVHELQTQQNHTDHQIAQNQDNQKHWQEQLAALAAKKAAHTENQTLNDWLQVRNYLQISYTNLLFLQDSPQALAWLTSAHNLVSTMESPDKRPILTSITSLIQAVQHLPKLDKSESMDRLDALKDAIFALEKDTITQKYEQEKATSPKPATWQDWLSTQYWHNRIHHAFAQFIERIFSSVAIHHLESAEDLPLSDLALANLQSSSTMLIEQAQWGVLYNNQTIFQHALQQLEESLEKSAPDSTQRQAILTEITALKQTAVHAAYPHYSTTIDLINQQIQAQKVTAKPSIHDSSATLPETKTDGPEQTASHETTPQETTPLPLLTIT